MTFCFQVFSFLLLSSGFQEGRWPPSRILMLRPGSWSQLSTAEGRHRLKPSCSFARTSALGNAGSGRGRREMRSGSCAGRDARWHMRSERCVTGGNTARLSSRGRAGSSTLGIVTPGHLVPVGVVPAPSSFFSLPSLHSASLPRVVLH